MRTTNTTVALKLGDVEFDVEMTIPAEPVKPQAMLPIFRSLTNGLVDIAIEASAQTGKPISCKKGCGACCRMAIPISGAEAHRLREVIDEMPEPRRSEIRQRFADASKVFRDEPYLEYMFQRSKTDAESKRVMAALDAYYAKGVPCPFLEDESCSIYEERPLICRQFVVTSPAEYCARIDGQGVERVPLLARPSDALILTVSEPSSDRVSALPMTELYGWTDRNPDTIPERTGQEWLDTFLTHLKGKALDAKSANPEASGAKSKPALNLQAILSRAFPDGPESLSQQLPHQPAKPQQILPVLQKLTNALIQISVEAVHTEGLEVSCKKGCSACCLQVVPVTVPEAYALRDLVAAMPEPRRGEIERRFAEGFAKLKESGAVDGILNASGTDRDEIAKFGLSYFAQGVPCPFLEDHACSIHPDRPLACREFLVTSPAVNCQSPSPDSIERVPMASFPSRALMLTAPGAREGKLPLVPLIAVMDWTATHPDSLPLKPGPQWLNEFAGRLKQLEKK